MKFLLYSLTALCLLTGFSSCIKKDPILSSAQVLFVPLSPNAPAVDFYFNNSFVARTVNYSSTIGTATYGFPYFITNTGTLDIRYTRTGITSANLASISKPVQEDRAYSSFLIDSVGKAKVAWVEDDLSDPDPGKVKFRFFHFSPNAPAVDVEILNTTTGALFTNRTFNDQDTDPNKAKFINITPGVYQFVFKLAGTNTVAYTTTSLTLVPDRIYSLAARGFVGGTGSAALGAWFYVNKP
jgi:Domain of unknown function (DUF4397)